MIKTDLRSVLFGGDDAEKLFETAQDLAKSISKGSVSFNNPKTLSSLLSLVLSGKRMCSEELRKGIIAAAKTKAEGAAEEIDKLIKRIELAIEQHNAEFKKRSETETPPTGVIDVPKAVPELWDRVAAERGLVCVEYRDHSQSQPKGKYEKMAKKVGEAIAKGAALAMFQPYGKIDVDPKPSPDFYLPETLRHYLAELDKKLGKAYISILTYALDFARENGLNEDEVFGRIMLYRRGLNKEPSASILTASGLQSRLFYVEIPNEGREKSTQEVWQWVSTIEGRDDVFVQRPEKSLPKELVRDLFYPISHSWSEDRRLLTTNVEIKAAIKFYEGYVEGRFPSNYWETYYDDKDTVLQKVEEFIPLSKKLAGDTSSE